MIIPTLLCYFSQSLSDAMFQLQEGKNPFKIISYLMQSIFLYGNAYYLTVKCTFLAIFKVPAKFKVTPKNENKVTLKEAINASWEGAVFSIITIIVCISFSGSTWILLSFLPGSIGWILVLKSNFKSTANKETEQIIKEANQKALSEQKHAAVDWRL